MTNFITRWWNRNFGSNIIVQLGTKGIDESYYVKEPVKVFDDKFEEEKQVAVDSVTSMDVLSDLDKAIKNCKNCTDVVFVLKIDGQEIDYKPNLSQLAKSNGLNYSTIYKKWKVWENLSKEIKEELGSLKILVGSKNVEIVKFG